MSEQAAASKLNAQAASGGVLVKLISFSVALGVLPLGTYYGTINKVWHGDTTLAAISAVVAANLVLVAYIFLSIWEDRPKPQQPNSQMERAETRKEK